jgi:uncharacterized damage-inducible protein DinB
MAIDAPFERFSPRKQNTLKEKCMSQGLTPEFALGYRAMMLDGVVREAECTKKVIAAIPDAKSDYKPDPNARSAKELAWHLANSDIQFLDGIADLNFDSMQNPEHKPQTSAEVVAWYGENIARGVARIQAMTPEQLMTPVAFFGMFNLPAVLYLSFLNNHSIHHRGQLAMYLRPMGSRVPSIYGGSFDEPFQPPVAAEQPAA